jgi:hypothetical protein
MTVIHLYPKLDVSNAALVEVYNEFRRRLNTDAAFAEMLSTNTRAAGLIREAFCPRGSNDPTFCKWQLLESLPGESGRVGLKDFVRNQLRLPEYYDVVYRTIEDACKAQRCRHSGECSEAYPAEPNSLSRPCSGFRPLIERMREAGEK